MTGVNMKGKRVLDEQLISDIILCEPITTKGRDSLKNLHLDKYIDPEFFYTNLYVQSKYEKNKRFHNVSEIENLLYYEYTADFKRFKMLQSRLKNFNEKFDSDLRTDCPLLMIGIAGNGKSIEINRQILKLISKASCKLYFDLEFAVTKIIYGVEYNCPNSERAIWLFCIKILDGIMQYIKFNHLLCSDILNNFYSKIVAKNFANEKQKNVFNKIGEYRYEDNETETEVFKSLLALLDGENAVNDIKSLLEILMLIMYSAAPNNKNYIVFDNIEEYIVLNDSKIQIPNNDISLIYKAIKEVICNMDNNFRRIQEGLVWKAFKIIIVSRRTSIGLIDPSLLQNAGRLHRNINDMTGHFQISEIWDKKKKHIWDARLKQEFKQNEAKKINILDKIMNDGKKAIGTDYQAIISSLMCYGIRRNAKAQAYAASMTYEILAKTKINTINFKEFNKLLKLASQTNAIRYMFRRALIEFQFKNSIAGGSKLRWELLNIGHLAGKKETNINGKKTAIENVAYNNSKCITLFRRVLTYLSYFTDDNGTLTHDDRTESEMFATIPLYSLIRGVLWDPVKRNEIRDEDYLNLARVLIGLSDMSNDDTKGAPFAILGIKDENFHKTAKDTDLKDILKQIWETGEVSSSEKEKYNFNDYGIRITSGGYSFLLDWYCSYSFMASLYCYTLPPLFFLKDISFIKYIIKKVYYASERLCNMFEQEAKNYCGNEITLIRDQYLPKRNGKFFTFKERVKELHIEHLRLYSTYVEKNYEILGMNENMRDCLVLPNGSKLAKKENEIQKGFIDFYIDKYSKWDTREECF